MENQNPQTNPQGNQPQSSSPPQNQGSGQNQYATSQGSTTSTSSPSAQAQTPPAGSGTYPLPSPLPNQASNPPSRKRSLIPITIIVLIGGLLLAVLASSFFFYRAELQKSSNTQPTKEPLRKSIIFGTDASYKPMEYVNEKGQLAGYDIDLAYKISQRLGTRAEIKHIPWEELFTALEQGKIDAIISSVSITEERKKKYLFSRPYFNAGQVIITRKDNTSISSTKDLQGKKVGVAIGTTNEEEAKKYTSKELVFGYSSDFQDALNDLESGKVDALLADLTGAKGYVDARPLLKIASDPFTNEFYGIVFRKDQTDLANSVNAVLEEFEINGILTDLKKKWFE